LPVKASEKLHRHPILSSRGRYALTDGMTLTNRTRIAGNAFNHWVLVGIALCTLSACGGGDEEDTAEAAAAVNHAPTITGTPNVSAQAGSSYSFAPAAADTDGDTLSFQIANKPGWANFSTATGALSGTPGDSDVGQSGNITITVTDSQMNASLQSFRITVAARGTSGGNTAPTIAGNPATSLNAGSAYSFQPSANDANGNTLTFSIQNKPAWATFNATNGRLSGTPDAGNVGSYAGIVISVSDGVASAQLPTFAITVNQISLGSATLNWSAPTQNADGTPLTNLSGYRLYYGTDAGNLNTSIQIGNPSITTQVVENLSAATWFFALRTVTAAGVESALTNVVSTTIQ
jgi:hypothetical protein